MSSARALYRALHGEAPTGASRASITVPTRLIGMGALSVLEVRRASGRVEQWHFDPCPRLAFTRVTADTSGRSDLWIIGGNYRVDGRGFHNVGTQRGLDRLDLDRTRRAHPEVTDGYQRTHGGMNPREAWRGSLAIGDELVPIGPLYAVTYTTDKNDGTYPYRHPFEDDAQPLVCVCSTGKQLVLVGGRYTVTPHGIEDGE